MKTLISNEKFFNIIGIIIMFIMVYFSHDTLLIGTNSKDYFSYIRMAVLLVVFACLITVILVKKIRMSKFDLTIICALLILNFITMITNKDFSIKYFFEMFLIVICYVQIISFGIEKTKKDLVNVMFFLALISLICFLLSYFFYPVFGGFKVFENSVGKKFYFLLLTFIEFKDNSFDNRNYGIFREPGVFAILLCFVLLLLLFKNKHTKQDYIKMVVVALTILTTFSTAGIIVMVGFFGLFILYKKQWKFALIMVPCLIILALCMGGTNLFYKVFGKLLNPNNDSFVSRFGSFPTNIVLWASVFLSIFFGKGFKYVEANFSNTAHQLGYFTVHNTNTFLKALAVYGIFYVVILLKGLYVCIQKITKNRWITWLLLIVLFLGLSNEDLIYNVVLYYFVLIGIIQGNGNRRYRDYESYVN